LVPQIDRHQSQPGQFLLMDVLAGTECCPAACTPAQAQA